jgi:hypothetical protein
MILNLKSTQFTFDDIFGVTNLDNLLFGSLNSNQFNIACTAVKFNIGNIFIFRESVFYNLNVRVL